MIKTVTHTIAIDEVRSNKDQLLTSCFTDSEKADLSGGHIQSVAGCLAVKRAFIEHGTQLVPGITKCEKEFCLAHGVNGQLQIEDAPEDFLNVEGRRVFISVTHTKTSALGMVTIEDNSDG